MNYLKTNNNSIKGNRGRGRITNNQLLLIIFTVLLITTFLLPLSCKKQPEEIKIGAILPLTGLAAPFGQWMSQGEKLAVEEINDKGGINGKLIKLIIEDGAGDPKTSVAAYKKVVESEKAKIIITTLSPVSLTLIPLVDKDNVLLFANAAHPGITGKSGFVFRHSNTADKEAEIIGKFILSKSELRKITSCILNDDFGISFREELVKSIKGRRNLNGILFERGKTDFRTIVQKVITDKPDIVVCVGYPKQLGLLTKRLREYKYKGTIITNMSFNSPDAINTAGEAAKGIYYTDFDLDSNNPDYIKLSRKYKEKFGGTLPFWTLSDFNTIKLIVRAVSEVGYDPEKISKFLKNLKRFESTGEIVSITSNGDIIPKMKISQYK